MCSLRIELFENRSVEGLLAKTDAGAGSVVLAVNLMPRNWRAGPRLVILHFSEILALTSIAALVASFGNNSEMSSTYNSIRIPSLRR